MAKVAFFTKVPFSFRYTGRDRRKNGFNSQIDQEQVLLQLQTSFLLVEDVRNQTMREC